jgi:hypothetical protein
MAFLCVTVDESIVASIDTQGKDLIAVNVGGSRISPNYAELTVMGGTYARDGSPTHPRIWVAQTPLNPGQTVTVALLSNAEAVGEGMTLDEAYPEDSDEPKPRLTGSRADIAMQLRQVPPVRDGFKVQLVARGKPVAMLETAPAEFGFQFSVLWTGHHEVQASVSLSAHSLDFIDRNLPARHVALDNLLLDNEVRFELVGW